MIGINVPIQIHQRDFSLLGQSPMLRKSRNPFHGEDAWNIPEQTRSEYSQLFTVYDQDHDGFLLGNEVKPIFTKSKLDNSLLVSIWYVSLCCETEERRKEKLFELNFFQDGFYSDNSSFPFIGIFVT